MVFVSLWINAVQFWLSPGSSERKYLSQNKKRWSEIDKPPLSCLMIPTLGTRGDGFLAIRTEEKFRLDNNQWSQCVCTRWVTELSFLERLLAICSRKSYHHRTFCLIFCCETFIKTLIHWIHNGDNISWFSESVGWVRAELVTKMGEPPADPSVVLIRFPPVKTNPERQKNRIIIFYPNIPESHIMTFSGWRTTSNKIICQAARSWSSNIFVGSSLWILSPEKLKDSEDESWELQQSFLFLICWFCLTQSSERGI